MGGHSGEEGRERHRNKDGVTSTPNTQSDTDPRLRAVSGMVQHMVGSIYIKPCGISRGIRQWRGQTAAERAPAQSRQQAECIRTPTVLPPLTTLGFWTPSGSRLSPEPFIIPAATTHGLAHSTFLTSLPFSYIWTFLLLGYLQKYHLGLCIHPR